MKTALLIIDLQRALCSGEYAITDANGVVERVNAVSARARRAGIPVVFVQHEEGEGPLVHESEGWQLADGLVAQAGDLRVRKTKPDSFHGTPLLEMLQSRGIERLVICGAQTEYCVDSTTRRALHLGYQVALASDAHSTLDNGVLPAAQIIAHHNATLRGMGSQLIPAAEVTL